VLVQPAGGGPVVSAGLRWFSDAEVRRLCDLDELAGALREALVALSEGRASAPPRIAALSPAGLLAAMPGYVEGLGMAAKLVTVYPGNLGGEIPSHQALVAAFDPRDGTPIAIIEGTYLTAIRTAMTAALAARALSQAGASSAAVLGAGVQGEAHLVAWRHLRPDMPVRVWSRHAESAARLVKRAGGELGTADSPEAAVRGAEVVFCCTDSRHPVLQSSWVADGTHVSSVGTGRELPHELVRRARLLVVESRMTVVEPPPAGAEELSGTDPADLVELGEVLSGAVAGRASPDDVTVYKSTGHAAEDVAAAATVLRRAGGRGGTTLER
jgi:alanine dehydrogenase